MPLTVMTTATAARLRSAELTWEVGQTACVLPSGFHHLRRSAVIAAGAGTFAEVVDKLLGWHAHVWPTLRVSPSTRRGGAGHRGADGGGGRACMDCCAMPGRSVVNDPTCRGVAYGTLAGHPNRGEQAFSIESHDE